MYFRSLRARSATDAPGNDVALDLRKPQLNLIEPRRIGRREVETDFWILLQRLLHRFGLVGGQIVEHDVDALGPPCLLTSSTKENNKLRTGVPIRRPAFCLAGLHIQRGVERQNPVTVVLETMSLRSPRR